MLTRTGSKSYDNNINHSCSISGGLATSGGTLSTLSHSNTAFGIDSSANKSSSTSRATVNNQNNRSSTSTVSNLDVTLTNRSSSETVHNSSTSHHHQPVDKSLSIILANDTSNQNSQNNNLLLTSSASSSSSSPSCSNDSATSSSYANPNDFPQLVVTQHNAQHVTEHLYDNNNSLNLIDFKPIDFNQEVPTTLTTPSDLNMNDYDEQQNSLVQQQHIPVLTFQVDIDDSIKRKIDEKLRECSSGDSDSESDHNIYLPKAVDLPSAQRLAKRLYFLDGFKAADVARHLSKK